MNTCWVPHANENHHWGVLYEMVLLTIWLITFLCILAMQGCVNSHNLALLECIKVINQMLINQKLSQCHASPYIYIYIYGEAWHCVLSVFNSWFWMNEWMTFSVSEWRGSQQNAAPHVIHLCKNCECGSLTTCIWKHNPRQPSSQICNECHLQICCQQKRSLKVSLWLFRKIKPL